MGNFSKSGILASQGWIHELARVELNPGLDALQSLNGSNPHQWVEEATVDMLTDMRGHVQETLRAFNAYSEGGKKFAEVKVFNLAQTASDFMLYRNGIKLIFENTAHGVIGIHYSKHQPAVFHAQTAGGAGAVAGGDALAGMPGREELIANLGVFGRVHWMFRGEKVEAAEVVQHFFSDFVRMTREERPIKANKAQLLQQIKTLLQEQGLDL